MFASSELAEEIGNALLLFKGWCIPGRSWNFAYLTVLNIYQKSLPNTCDQVMWKQLEKTKHRHFMCNSGHPNPSFTKDWTVNPLQDNKNHGVNAGLFSFNLSYISEPCWSRHQNACVCVFSVHRPYGSNSHQVLVRFVWRHVNCVTLYIPWLSHLTLSFLASTEMDSYDSGLTPSRWFAFGGESI